jgi:hypothetical protein
MASNADKEYRLRITGDARELGATTKKATQWLNELKAESIGLASALTGGLIGGGIGGAVNFIVEKISEKIRETRQLMIDADRLDLKPSDLKNARRAEELLNLPSDTIARGIENARQARAEAAKGDPNALMAWKDLGLKQGDISGLGPNELFTAIAETLRKGNGVVSDAQRTATSQIIGKDIAAALIPYFVGVPKGTLDWVTLSQQAMQQASVEEGGSGGFNKNIQRMVERGGIDFTNLKDASDALANPNFRKRFRADLEPLAQFGQGDENRAKILDENNERRRTEIDRQYKSVAVQQLELKRERERIEMLRDAEPNVVRRKQYDAQLLDLYGQQRALEMTPQNRAPITPYQFDAYTRVGLRAFGSGDATLNLQKDQLKSIRGMEKRLQQLAVEVGVELAKNL